MRIFKLIICELLICLPNKTIFFLSLQITNGDSDLSKELSHQLTTIHNCRVILVRIERNNNNNDVDNRNINSNKNFNQTESNCLNDIDLSHELTTASVINCNLLDNNQLERCAQMTHNLYGEIDVLIENKIDADDDANKTNDCVQFINSTSDSIRSTINVCVISILMIRSC